MPDGGRLYTSDNRQPGKIAISMGVPYDLHKHKPYYRQGEEPNTHIGVSAGKSAAQIVADIQKRLVPGYQKLLADSIAARDRHDAAARAQLDAAKRLAAVLGVRVEQKQDGTVEPIYLNVGPVYCTIRLDSDGSGITIEHLTCRIDCAVELAAVLAKYAVEEKTEAV